MKLTGRVWKYGDNVDTDLIVPARHLALTDPEELGRHCMEDLDSSFAERVSRGDFVVAGRLFGSGSSREHAPLALKGAGVAAVIAISFARIFLRNAINVGLPVMECESLVAESEPADLVEVDLTAGTILNQRTGKRHRANAYPRFMLGIVEAGGLVEYTRRRLRPEDVAGRPTAQARSQAPGAER